MIKQLEIMLYVQNQQLLYDNLGREIHLGDGEDPVIGKGVIKVGELSNKLGVRSGHSVGKYFILGEEIGWKSRKVIERPKLTEIHISDTPAYGYHIRPQIDGHPVYGKHIFLTPYSGERVNDSGGKTIDERMENAVRIEFDGTMLDAFMQYTDEIERSGHEVLPLLLYRTAALEKVTQPQRV